MKRTGKPGWAVDLDCGLAVRDTDILSFEPGRDGTIAVAFVAGKERRLEEQCLIAGQAVRAIWSKIDAEGRRPY